jgi:serine protease inhibitor
MWKKVIVAGMAIVLISGVMIFAKGKKIDKNDLKEKLTKSIPDGEKVVNGNNEFALDMYTSLSHGDGNIFFSPYSISSALAMTYAGARGNTETQMAQTLHFTVDQELLHPIFSRLTKDLVSDKTKGYQLNIANNLWGQHGYKFIPAFLSINERCYGAGLNVVDFSKDTEGARQAINASIAKATQDKIKELIKAGILTPDTKLVLTNAIYFKSDWDAKFNKAMTKEDSFTLLKGEPIKTTMMHKRSSYKYAEAEDSQIIELPYVVSSTLSMVVFLPKQIDGITDCEKAFNIKNVEHRLSKLKPEDVKIYMPKFKMDYGCELQETLGRMGMADAFDAKKADLSGMSDEKPGLFIAKVIHQAFIDVNEEGTEAAAATGVVVAPTGRAVEPSKPIEFRADHPFIFMIRDMTTGSILFIGRLMDPRS